MDSVCRYQWHGKKERGQHRGADRRGDGRVHSSLTQGLSLPATTHCDEDRSCQWIHGAGISSQNLRKPTEATADPQLLELTPQKLQSEHASILKLNRGGWDWDINVGNEGKVQTLEVVRVKTNCNQGGVYCWLL